MNKIHIGGVAMPTFTQYLALRTLIETRSFSETGVKLNLTQSSISHAINNLEIELGITLIQRNRNNIKLTADGEIIYQHICLILQQQQTLENEIANLKNLIIGSLQIGVIPSVSLTLIPKILAYFEESFPSLSIRLIEGDFDQIEEWLRTGVIDLGFLVEPIPKKISFVPLFQDTLLCIMSEHHPLAKATSLTIQQLKTERWIMPKRNIDRDVSRLLSQHHIRPNIVHEIAVDQVILSMVNANLGISIMPETLLEYSPPSLVKKSFESHYSRTVGIAYIKESHLTPGAKKFIDICKEFSQSLNFC